MGRDRDFVRTGRATILANNPALFVTSTPLGSTTNIRSSNGSNLVLKAGNVPLNSPFTFVPVGYAGTATDNGAALVANAGRYNLELADTNQQSHGGGYPLLMPTTVESASLTVRRQFTPNLQVFLDAGASNHLTSSPYGKVSASYSIAANAPNNPFTQAITVAAPVSDGDRKFRVYNFDRRISGGLIARLPKEWTGELNYVWNRTRRHTLDTGYGLVPSASGVTLANAISNGSLDVLRDTNLYPVDVTPFEGVIRGGFGSGDPAYATLKNTTLRASGPAFSLPAGPIQAAARLEYRDEMLGETFGYSTPNVTQPPALSAYAPSRSQHTFGAYAELLVPLVSTEQKNIPLVRELELQLAARRDEYTTKAAQGAVTAGVPTVTSRTTNKLTSEDPTIGLRYQPIRDLTLRASYGTGFLPPSVTQLTPNFSTLAAGQVRDPKRGNEPNAAIPITSGGNPNLSPELSESWSAGAILTPRVLSGLRLSVDYTRIEKTGNITGLQAQAVLDNEDSFPGRVTRGPVPAGDPYGVGPVVALNNSSINLAWAFIEAYDVQLDYQWKPASRGTFDFYALATWQTHYKTQQLPTSPIVENVGDGARNWTGLPLKFKANAGVTWTSNRWTLGWNAQHFGSRFVSPAHVVSQGSPYVASQTSHDVFAAYRFPAGSREGGFISSLMRNTEVQLGVKNVFRKDPSLDMWNGHYHSYDIPWRGSTYYVSAKRRF